MMAFLLDDENGISIKVVTFAGKDKTVLIKRNEYRGLVWLPQLIKC